MSIWSAMMAFKLGKYHRKTRNNVARNFAQMRTAAAQQHRAGRGGDCEPSNEFGAHHSPWSGG